MMKEMKKDVRRRLIAIVVSLAFVVTGIYIPNDSIDVYAREDRSANFNTNYSLNGTPQENIIAVARAQIGRRKADFGYNEAWCADFVSDCAIKAGLSDIIPADGWCASFYNKIVSKGGQAVSSPQAGDIVFYYCTKHTNHWVHVGLMINSTQSIEGNYGGKVTLVNGWYNDGTHNTGNYVQKRYLRPAYGNLEKVQEKSLPGTRISYWFSRTKMGDAISSVKNGETVYFCYELTRQDNGSLVDVGNYSVKQIIYYPDGSKWDNTYENSNNNWVSFTANKGGNYKCVLELTGDWSGTYTLTLDNVPSLKTVSSSTWFSSSDMGTETYYLEKGKQYYFCFKVVTDEEKYLNDATNISSVTKMSVKAPDGSSIISTSKNNIDRYSVKFTASKTGRYTSSYTFQADGLSELGGSGYADCKDTSKKMTKISVTKKPSKLVYTVGEKLDTTGLEVTATYSDGTTKVVTDKSYWAYSTEEAGTAKVMISYTEDDVVKFTCYYITVKEKEAPKINVSYDLNGGTTSTGESSYSASSIKKGGKYTVTSDVPIKYVTISYDTNGGDTVVDDEKIKLKLNVWTYTANGKSKWCLSGNEITLNEDTVLKASYIGSKSGLEPKPTREGYIFDGWYCNGKPYNWPALSKDVHLVAHWVKDNTIKKTVSLSKISITKNPLKTIYYIGESINSNGVEVVATYSDGSKKTVTGYQISCDTSKAGNVTATVKYTENSITKTTSFNVTVKEKESEKITITYDTDGGTMLNTTQQIGKDDYVDVTTEKPKKNYTIKFNANGGTPDPADITVDCTFKYWSYKVGNGNSVVLSTGTRSYYKPGKDCTIIANYENAKISQDLPQVSKNGYTFLGWYQGNGTKVQKGDAVTDNITLTAQWKKNEESMSNSGQNTSYGNDQADSNNSNQTFNDTNTTDDSDTFNVVTEDDDIDNDDNIVEIGDELSTDDATYTVTGLDDSKTVEYTECESENKKVTIPATVTVDGVTYRVTSIGDEAFYKNTRLTAVSIGANVTSIGKKAFYGCTKLKQIVVNSIKITNIGKNAFKKVPKSVKVLLPKVKYASYKKMFKKAGISVKAKFKKIK